MSSNARPKQKPWGRELVRREWKSPFFSSTSLSCFQLLYKFSLEKNVHSQTTKDPKQIFQSVGCPWTVQGLELHRKTFRHFLHVCASGQGGPLFKCRVTSSSLFLSSKSGKYQLRFQRKGNVMYFLIKFGIIYLAGGPLIFSTVFFHCIIRSLP